MYYEKYIRKRKSNLVWVIIVNSINLFFKSILKWESDWKLLDNYLRYYLKVLFGWVGDCKFIENESRFFSCYFF